MTRIPSQWAPYQVLFPVGFAGGLAGITLWIPFGFITDATYPGASHALLMILGFFLPITCGFLLTALPHFLASAPASRTEIFLMTATALGILLAAWLNQPSAALGGTCLALLQLIRFGTRRLHTAPRAAPAPFALLASGILLASGSSFLLWWHATIIPIPLIATVARSMLLYGFPLIVILGVGSDVLPMFLQLGQRPRPLRTGNTRLGSNPQATQRFAMYGALLIGSYLLDGWQLSSLGWGLRSVVTTMIMIREWRLFHYHRITGYFARGVFISAWSTLISVWCMALFPNYALHAAHGFFIGGIALLIFTVATRVIVAHGGYDLQLERRSWAVLAMLIGMGLALLTRITAPLTGHYTHHLAYAALCWCAAVGCWGWVFFPKILRHAPPPTHPPHSNPPAC